MLETQQNKIKVKCTIEHKNTNVHGHSIGACVVHGSNSHISYLVSPTCPAKESISAHARWESQAGWAGLSSLLSNQFYFEAGSSSSSTGRAAPYNPDSAVPSLAVWWCGVTTD